MTFKTTQKIIRIGTSSGVTIPAKQLKKMGAKPGDTLEISFKLANEPKDELASEYAAFTKQYGETLKHLAHR